MSINQEVEDFLIELHTMVPIRIERSFITHRKTITARLQGAVSQIHYGIDLWSSPNRKSFLGICAQFVDNEYKLQKALLALPQVRFSPSGETLASHILDTLQAYDIAEKTRYIVRDNVSSNQTCVAALAKGLVKLGVEFDPRRRRIRCRGHTINLSLDAFLFATTVEAPQAAIDAIKDDADLTVVEVLQEQLREKQGKRGAKQSRTVEPGWKSIGALGNLYMIAVFIRSTTLLSEKLETLTGRALGIDNATRRNSWYNLLKVAIEKQDKLMIFCQKYHKKLGCLALSSGDWETLKMPLGFLQLFVQATLIQELK